MDVRCTYLTIREKIEQSQCASLSVFAAKANESLGRDFYEAEDDMRTCYQRDRDRILHCKSFRRLKHKTQVFFSPEGDHYRTRLTHTLEVSQIARTIARALQLNEDLVEAIALGHDLGHTPFGHAGEFALDALFEGGFEHSVQSLRVVEKLERKNDAVYYGLNLTKEVRDGIKNHSFSCKDDPITLEGQVVKLSDKIAYVNHDIDDAKRAGLMVEDDIPRDVCDVLGYSQKARLDVLVKDVIDNSSEKALISQSSQIREAMLKLRSHIFEAVYDCETVKTESDKASEVVKSLFKYYVSHGEIDLSSYSCPENAGCRERQVVDYIAGMTDGYALRDWIKLFGLKTWNF